MVTYHAGNLQIFNSDGLIAIDVVAGSFMERILTLVGDALMDTSDKVPGFLTPLAALLAPGKFALSLGKLLCTFLGMFRVLNNVPVAIGYQVANTHIQPNAITLLGQGLRFRLTDTLHIPARGAQDNTGKFERALQWDDGRSHEYVRPFA